MFDLVRLDHFRGFVSYWAVPAGARTAAGGRWRRGPGRALFDALERELGSLAVVAEDLGVITPAVTSLREALGFPGMVVLQFGFDPRAPRSVHRFENHAEDRVVYTGTHDHDTARGWYSGLSVGQRSFVDAAFARFGVVEREPWWRLIRLALRSPARVAMLQAQDVLGLGSSARMNNPGRAGGSWRWRMEAGASDAGAGARLREATEEAGRLAVDGRVGCTGPSTGLKRPGPSPGPVAVVRVISRHSTPPREVNADSGTYTGQTAYLGSGERSVRGYDPLPGGEPGGDRRAAGGFAARRTGPRASSCRRHRRSQWR